MRRSFNIFLFTMVSCLLSCNNKQLNEDVIVPLNNGKVVQDVNLSDYVQYTHYVPLETNDSCLIQSINRVWSDSNYLIVYDYAPLSGVQRLYLFSDKGDFLNQIGTEGRGPAEYMHISSVYIDRVNNHVGVICGVNAKLQIYTYEGDFVRSYKISTEYIYMDDLALLPDGNLLAHYPAPPKPDAYYRNIGEQYKYEYRLLVPTGDSLISKPLTAEASWANKGNQAHLILRPTTYIGGDVYGVSLFSNTIWQYDEQELKPKYTFDVGRNMIDSAFIETYKEENWFDYNMMSTISNSGFTYGFGYVVTSDQYTLLKVNLNDDILIFDGADALLIEKGDLWGFSDDFWANMSAISLIETEAIDIESGELLKIRDSITEDSNPVVCRYYLKDNLIQEILSDID